MLTNEFFVNELIPSDRPKFINSTNIVLSNASLSTNTPIINVTQNSKIDIIKPNSISEFNINVLATPTKIKFLKKDSITKSSINSEFSPLHKNSTQVISNKALNYDLINIDVPISLNPNFSKNWGYKHNHPSQEKKIDHSQYSQANISHPPKLNATPLTVDISIRKYDQNTNFINSSGSIPINETRYTHVPFNNSTVYIKPWSNSSILNGSLPCDNQINQAPIYKDANQMNISNNIELNQQESFNNKFNKLNINCCLNSASLPNQTKPISYFEKKTDGNGSFNDHFDNTLFDNDMSLKLNSGLIENNIIRSSNKFTKDLNLEIEPIKCKSSLNLDNSINNTPLISPRKVPSNNNTLTNEYNIFSPPYIKNISNEKNNISSQQLSFTNGSTIKIQSRALSQEQMVLNSKNESQVENKSMYSPQHFSFTKFPRINEGVASKQQNNFIKELELNYNGSNASSPLHINKSKKINEDSIISPQQKNTNDEYKPPIGCANITLVSSPRHFSLFKSSASIGNKNIILSPEQAILNDDKIFLNNSKGFSSPQHFSSNKYAENGHVITSTNAFNDDFSSFCSNIKPPPNFSLNKDTIGQFSSGGGSRKKPTFILPPSKTDKENRESEEIDRKYEEIMKLSGRLLISGKRSLIDINEMESILELGHGTCGYVIEMLHRPSNTTMAVKQMRRSGSYEENKRIIMDLDIVMKCLSCPNIVQCYGTFITQTDVWICMELMSTCLDKLMKAYKQPIPERILGKIAVSTVDALNYLKENHEVIHRDVKPSNILLDDGGRIKLCDFGISGRLVDSKAKTRSAGCTAYMAPERIDPPDPTQPDYDIRADVWSLGLTLVELATCQFPYKNCETDFELLSKILMEPAPRLPSNSGFSMDFGSFVSQCLTKDYIRRPKYQELFKHNFILRYRSLFVDVQSWYSQVKLFIQQEDSK